jgi:hypothetical protein
MKTSDWLAIYSFLKQHGLQFALGSSLIAAFLAMLSLTQTTPAPLIPEFEVNNQVLQVRYADEPWQSLFSVAELNGTNGVHGRDIELQVSETHLEWRRTNETEWTSLLALEDLLGEDGAFVELRTQGMQLQWKYNTESVWKDLFSLSLLQGPARPAGADGADGAQGPRGISGQTGPQGLQGTQGVQGPAGLTPSIGNNGNWFIGTTDTGVRAQSTPNELRYVNTASGLQAMNECLSCTYVLTSGIELGGVSWIPVGNEDTPFTGNLLGQGHTIHNFSITTLQSGIGFFGAIDGAHIENLIFLGGPSIAVDGDEGVGFLTAFIQGEGKTKLSNLTFEGVGTVRGNVSVGYLAGAVLPDTEVYVSDIYINGRDVLASTFAGTLFGYVDSSDVVITDLFVFSTDVEVTSGYGGGLIGTVFNSQVLFRDTYTEIDMEVGGDYIGGMIGAMGIGADVSINNAVHRIDINDESNNEDAEPAVSNKVGGVVGGVVRSTLSIRDLTMGDGDSEFSYLFGNTNDVGGVVGFSLGSEISIEGASISIELSYPVGNNIGGLIGSVDSFFDASTTRDSEVYLHNITLNIEQNSDEDEGYNVDNNGGLIGYAFGLRLRATNINVHHNTVISAINVGGLIGHLTNVKTSGTTLYERNSIDIENSRVTGYLLVYQTSGFTAGSGVHVGGAIGRITDFPLTTSGINIFADQTGVGEGSFRLYNVVTAFRRMATTHDSGTAQGGLIGSIDGGNAIIGHALFDSMLATNFGSQVGGLIGHVNNAFIQIYYASAEGGLLEADDLIGGFFGELTGINIVDIYYSTSAIRYPTSIIARNYEGDYYGRKSTDTKLDIIDSLQLSPYLTNN